ncbi:Calcium-responsive transcription factor [Labeo rohita]|uniref:Calcium-responsive transcription factor n=1 Tax=Labeo rohita TaxID=84645 RepID=A0ABQ8N039_LABRO|nr:Calcium-responsive transcription factor [Labeo rohita]
MATSCCQRFTSKECFELKLRGFEEDTMTKFVVWTKDKAFGVDDPKPGSKKIMWQLQYVPFDGIPFMVLGRRVYSCHLGVDKHKHEKQKRQLQLGRMLPRRILLGSKDVDFHFTKRLQIIFTVWGCSLHSLCLYRNSNCLLNDQSEHCYEERRRRLQDSKKLDCPARIYVVHLIRFPDYKIPDDIHKQRKESSERLRRALTANPSAVKFEEQYVACFPGIEEHKNHPLVAKAAEVHKPADTRVEKHIEKLALAGARKVSEVRRNVPRDSGIPQKVTSNSSSDISSPPKDTSSPPNDTSIPHKDTSNPPNDTSKTKKIEKCGSLLREISDLTYHLQDEPFLDSLTVRLNDLLEDVKRHAPHNDTVPLSYTPPSKKIRYLKALSMIPKKQLTSGRFGCHAEASKANFSTDVM